MSRKPEDTRLRRGWTTGACAAAAAKAAYVGLTTGAFPDPVVIRLPKGEEPGFDLVGATLADGGATVAVVKDAGDDPDVTHGATVRAAVRILPPGAGIVFRAGPGVGTVTKPGLPIPPGEPAINPKPREIIAANLSDVGGVDVEVTISIPGGEALAEKTWNPRLGIVGGLSVLGTTGIVIPYSCAAWIHSIHRGIDVARATGRRHMAAATGKTSEDTVRRHHDLPLEAMIDMGDFAGGMLKYLRRHPLPRVTIAGGFAKLAKLSQGHMDLHSSRSQLDLTRLAETAARIGAEDALRERIAAANTGAEALSHARAADLPLAETVARQAREAALAALSGETEIDVMIVDRDGTILAEAAP